MRFISQETMQYVNASVLIEVTMLELRVYYDDVLRYTIIANWDKVQDLRNKGFIVQVNEAPPQGSGLSRRLYSSSLPVNGRDDVIVRHDGEFGVQNRYT